MDTTLDQYTKYDQAIAIKADYTPAIRDMLHHLVSLLRGNRWTIAQLGRELNEDASVINRLLLGTYPKDPANVCAAISNALSLYESRTIGVDRPRYVNTVQARRIWETADDARQNQRIRQIIGKTQIGKTWAAKEYARTHAKTIYTYIPRPVTIGNVARNLAKACGVSAKGSVYEITDRIRDTLTSSHLVIIDEMQQLMLMDTQGGVNALEWLRLEIYDQVECGMLMIADNAWGAAFSSEKAIGSIERTTRRGGKLILPDLPTRQDVEAFRLHYGFPSTPDPESASIITRAANAYGMRVLGDLFHSASQLAAQTNDPIDWIHFLRAYDRYVKLNGNI